MVTIESSIRHIPHPQERIFATVSDFSRLDTYREKIPQDFLDKVDFTADTISVKGTPAGTICLRIIEREAPKTVKLESENTPVKLNLWIQLVAEGEQAAKMRLTIKADVNAFMATMVKKPLTEAIEKLADVLEHLPYQ